MHSFYLLNNLEDVGMSFLDHVTDDIVVDWEWTLVASEWLFVLNFFFSLSYNCLTLSWEFELEVMNAGEIDLNFENSLDATFHDGTSSFAVFCEICAKWYKKLNEEFWYLRIFYK